MLSQPVLLTLASAWLVAAVAMLLLWAWHRRNASILDVGWAAIVGGLAVAYAVLGHGAVARRSAIGWMMGSCGRVDRTSLMGGYHACFAWRRIQARAAL